MASDGLALAFGGGYFEPAGEDIKIWKDDTECTADDLFLQECKSKSWGTSNCHHCEDMGVICDGGYMFDSLRLCQLSIRVNSPERLGLHNSVSFFQPLKMTGYKCVFGTVIRRMRAMFRLSGEEVVGVMCVMTSGALKKQQLSANNLASSQCSKLHIL